MEDGCRIAKKIYSRLCIHVMLENLRTYIEDLYQDRATASSNPHDELAFIIDYT